MSDFKTGVMVNLGAGGPRWSSGDAVTTDPSSADFVDTQMFDVMAKAGKIEIDPEPRFACEQCDKDYKTEAGLERHVAKKHEENDGEPEGS